MDTKIVCTCGEDMTDPFCEACFPAPTYAILADGQEWEDSEGLRSWPEFETDALAELLVSQGYDVEVVPL